MIRTISLTIAAFLGGLLVSGAVLGEAYIAVREGYKCSQCHFNKTGGGKRNDFANTYVQTRLSQYFVKWQPPGEESGESAVGNMYHGRLNDFVSLGADFRFTYSERHIPHVKGPERDMSINSGLLYLQMDMVPGSASLYLDQTIQGTSSARELFILFDDLALDSYVKLGRFFLASGYRLQDDTAFVRQYPGFTYGNPDSGFEVGFEPGPFSVSVWSTSLDKKRGVTASVIWKPARIGVSYNLDSSIQGTKKAVANIFAGLHLGRFTGLAEVDQIVTETTSKVNSVALLGELNYMVTKGANVKLTYEGYDPNRNETADRVERISLIYEPFVTQFLQIRVGGRDYIGQTSNDQENRKEFFIEMHGFFY
ncbi:MAG: hypothetical protein HY423_10045 [Candidatus Lambdaproteobacteria bacterium]|nr:hypothetical protein [Candidatus Lambdaproteobacteria bacterium]